MKRYLGQLRLIKKRLKFLDGEIEFIENEYLNIKSPGLKEPGGGFHGNMTALGVKMDKYDELYQTYKSEREAKKKEYLDTFMDILGTIELLPTNEYEIIYQRYVRMKRWEDIARETSYSISNVYKIHKDALNSLEKIKECSKL